MTHRDHEIINFNLLRQISTSRRVKKNSEGQRDKELRDRDGNRDKEKDREKETERKRMRDRDGSSL